MLSSLVAGVAGFVLGAVAAGEQYRLYREPEFREQRARGRKLLVMRLLLGAAMAVAFALAWRPDHYETGPRLVTTLFLAILLVLASTDFERRRIPDRLSLPAMVLAVALCWAWPDRSVSSIAIGTGVALGIGVFFFALGLFAGGGGALGMGDVKLMVLLGLVCGFPAAVSAILIGGLFAGIPAVALIAMGRGRSYFSYGPYLVLGGVAILLWPDRFV